MIAGKRVTQSIFYISFDGQPGKPVELYQSDDLVFFGSATAIANDGTLVIEGYLLRPE